MRHISQREITTTQPANQQPADKQSTRLEGESIPRRWYWLGIALLVVSILLHQPLLVVIGLLLILVLLLTDVWSHYCLHSLRYRRRLSEQRANFGEQVTFTLSIENAKLLPLPWLEVHERVPQTLVVSDGKSTTGSGTLLKLLFSVRWYERVSRRYTVACTARGVHTFGPTEVFSGDAFGFVKRQMRLDARDYLLVYPLVAPLTSFGLPARHPFGDRTVPRHLLEDPLRIVGVRDYTYGDSLRRVNWKATARTLQLQSNIYESTTTYTLVLFLNIASMLDMHYGFRPDFQELQVCVAASMASWAIEQDYAVGLHANTYMSIPDENETPDAQGTASSLQERLRAQMSRRRISIPATSNPNQLARILDTLARIQTFFHTDIAESMLAESARLPAGTTVVLVTTMLSEQVINVLLRMRRNGHTVAVLFVGDTPPSITLAGIALYYLGGEETWEKLLAEYGGEAHKKEEAMATSAGDAGFRL
ncbi:MAG TPA: DUF58 domain-containing protein [Ktedonobacteraceae bacterium]|nr:DUF58 domain-containing protein [Ktedonobacteraceae bacterium]